MFLALFIGKKNQLLMFSEIWYIIMLVLVEMG